jgi:hypothetical protein
VRCSANPVLELFTELDHIGYCTLFFCLRKSRVTLALR